MLQREKENKTDQGLDIAVRVIPGDGKPIPFSAVRVGITKVPGKDPVGTDKAPDGRGRLRTPLPAGRYHAYAEADGFPTAHSRPTFVFSGRYSRIVLTLERKGRQPQPEPSGGLVVVVTDASTKRLSSQEVRLVEGLVSRGMLLILAVGYEQRDAAAPLLERLGLAFGDRRGCGDAFPGETGRSVPLGFFKSPYLDDGGVMHHVRFHAAWPVRCASDDAEVLARGHWDMPVMGMRRCGKGGVLFVGDSAFIQNRNLENEDGAPFEGMRENADFWRWFFSWMSGGAVWVPPKQEGTGSGSEAATGVVP